MYEPQQILFFLGLQALSPEANGGIDDQSTGQETDLAQEHQSSDKFNVSEECKQQRNIQGPHQQFQRESGFTNCIPRRQYSKENFAIQTENFDSPRYHSVTNRYSRSHQYQSIPSFDCRRGINNFDSCAQFGGVRLYAR